jgi:hypothetical protein
MKVRPPIIITPLDSNEPAYRALGHAGELPDELVDEEAK